MLDPLLWGPPVVIAHRGSRELWPENTMIAFENALALGVEHLETDVHVSADGIVHCFHDDTLERVTGIRGRFVDFTSQEIAKLDAGHAHRGRSGFDYRSRAVAIPTFEELVTTFTDVRVVVDLKHDEVVEPLADLVTFLDVGDRLIVGSFQDERLARFRELTRGRVATSTGMAASRSWLMASRSGRPAAGPAGALQVPLQMRGLRVVDRKLIDAAHGAGLQVHVWTVNDPGEMRRLLDLGVDGLVTDRPDLAMRVVAI